MPLLLMVAVVNGCAAGGGAAPKADAAGGLPCPRCTTNTATAVAGPVDPRPTRGLAVLRAWDAARSRALAAGDAGALERLYTPGSGLAAQDLRLLRRYQRRGVRLADVRPQVLSADVRLSRPRLVELVVVERLARARVGLGSSGERALPGSSVVRRMLRFDRGRGAGATWRLSSATDG